jgi:DUF917 family protein
MDKGAEAIRRTQAVERIENALAITMSAMGLPIRTVPQTERSAHHLARLETIAENMESMLAAVVSSALQGVSSHEK